MVGKVARVLITIGDSIVWLVLSPIVFVIFLIISIKEHILREESFINNFDLLIRGYKKGIDFHIYLLRTGDLIGGYEELWRD